MVDDATVARYFAYSGLAFLVIVCGHLAMLHTIAKLFNYRKIIFRLPELPLFATILVLQAMMAALFTLHMLTNMAWGLFMYLAGVLESFNQCVYFAFENYTSLGLTRVQVDERWRMLAPMISFSGIFCLAWTTAGLASLYIRLYRADQGQQK